MSEQLAKRGEEGGEDRDAVVPTQSDEDRRVAEYLYSDPLLSLIGFFDAGYKRRKPTNEDVSKRVTLSDGRTFETVPTAKYGFPNTEDQDWLHGFEALLLARMERRTDYNEKGSLIRRPHLQLPITYHLREHIRASGKSENNHTVKSARQWVKRMSATTIEGAITYGQKNKRTVEGVTHLFRQATLIGEKLPDGTSANMVHVWPESWFLSRLAYLQAQLIDHAFYQRLGRFAYAKQLLPILYNAFYATDGRPWKKSYRDLCQLFGLTVFQKPARRAQQLDPGHRQLHKHGVLKAWGWSHGASDSILTFTPGPKYFEDLAARGDRRAQARRIAATEPEQPTQDLPPPSPSKPKPTTRTGNPYNLDNDQVPEAEHMADSAVEKLGNHSHRKLFFMAAAKAIKGNYVIVFWKVLSETADAITRPNHGIRHVPKYFASGVEAQAGQRDLIPVVQRTAPPRSDQRPATPHEPPKSATPPPPPRRVRTTPEPEPIPRTESFRDIVARYAPAIAEQLAAREQGTAPPQPISSPPSVAVPDAPSRGLDEDPASAGARPPGTAPGSDPAA